MEQLVVTIVVVGTAMGELAMIAESTSVASFRATNPAHRAAPVFSPALTQGAAWRRPIVVGSIA
jgi:hypothetical protein